MAARRVISESIAAAVLGYAAAATIEVAAIRWMQPTEWELAWVSDLVLAIALGVAVYLWRHLLTTRRTLEAHERAQLVLDSQLAVAADIQRRLLPAVPPAADGYEWAAALKSAGKVGGDFYDFVDHPSGVRLVLVADVSGKGVPAAMALGTLRAAFRALAHECADPAHIVTQLSATFYQEWLGSPYVTCIVAAFDLKTRMLTYTNAGHPPGLIVGAHGSRPLVRGGPPAGILENARFEAETIAMGDGDVCVLVSDGVTEALEGQRSLDAEIREIGAPHVPPSAAEMCQRLMARALEGAGPSGVAQWDDDRTVVVVAVGAQLPIPNRQLPNVTSLGRLRVDPLERVEEAGVELGQVVREPMVGGGNRP